MVKKRNDARKQEELAMVTSGKRRVSDSREYSSDEDSYSPQRPDLHTVLDLEKLVQTLVARNAHLEERVAVLEQGKDSLADFSKMMPLLVSLLERNNMSNMDPPVLTTDSRYAAVKDHIASALGLQAKDGVSQFDSVVAYPNFRSLLKIQHLLLLICIQPKEPLNWLDLSDLNTHVESQIYRTWKKEFPKLEEEQFEMMGQVLNKLTQAVVGDGMSLVSDVSAWVNFVMSRKKIIENAKSVLSTISTAMVAEVAGETTAMKFQAMQELQEQTGAGPKDIGTANKVVNDEVLAAFEENRPIPPDLQRRLAASGLTVLKTSKYNSLRRKKNATSDPPADEDRQSKRRRKK